MKKVLKYLGFLLLIAITCSTAYKDQRGIIRMIYGGDTLKIMFTGDTNKFTGNFKAFLFDGGIIADSFNIGGIWYKSFLTPSNQIDLSSFPDSSILIEMNDTISYIEGLSHNAGRLISKGIRSSGNTNNWIITSADTNKIINTGVGGVNVLDAKYRNIFKDNGGLVGYIDSSGLYLPIELTVRDTTIRDMILHYAGYSLTFGEGLTLDGSDVTLGGAFTENIAITSSDQTEFKVTTSMGEFQMGDNGFEISVNTWDLNSQISTLWDTAGSITNTIIIGQTQTDVIQDTNGLRYNRNLSSYNLSNDRWIPDKHTVDSLINASADTSGGEIDTVGKPVKNRIAIFDDSSRVRTSENLRYDDTLLTLYGELRLVPQGTGQILIGDIYASSVDSNLYYYNGLEYINLGFMGETI